MSSESHPSGSVPHCRFSHPVENDDVGGKQLPTHLESLKDGLLDFNNFVGLRAAMEALEDEGTDKGGENIIPLSAYKTDGVSGSQRAKEREFVESAQMLVKAAQSGLHDGNLQKSLQNVISGRVNAVGSSSPNSHCMIAYAESQLCNTGVGLPRPPGTNAKTVLYLGFPLPDAGHQKTTGFKNDPSFENYSFQTLSQLNKQGLRCVPFSESLADVAKMKRDGKELLSPLVCFPWGVIRIEGMEKLAMANDVLVTESICLASTAASNALSMFERLARFADEKHEGKHIPPVIAITAVGPNTTVWLAYCDIIDDQLRDHKMVHIWEGCISKIWDAIQFCRILDNVLFWTLNCLRPKVTHYLDQWRLRYCPEVPNIHSQLENDIETATIVHRIQDRLSSLNILPNKNLSELIQQAVVFQEVLRSSPEDMRPVSQLEHDMESSKKVIPLPSRMKYQSPEASPSAEVKKEGGRSSSHSSDSTLRKFWEASRFVFDTDLYDSKRKNIPSSPQENSTLQPPSARNQGAPLSVPLSVSKETTGTNLIEAKNTQVDSSKFATGEASLKSNLPLFSQAGRIEVKPTKNDKPISKPADIPGRSSMVKVPWKDKYITVRLPPGDQRSPSRSPLEKKGE